MKKDSNKEQRPPFAHGFEAHGSALEQSSPEQTEYTQHDLWEDLLCEMNVSLGLSEGEAAS